VVRVGPLELGLSTMRVRYYDRVIELTSYEFTILRVLAQRPGRVLTREQILELAKGTSDDAFDRSIDVRISKVRQKLGEQPGQPSIIRTVRGIGYVLAHEDR
jgi:DNA-binding response OmpR family regulator